MKLTSLKPLFLLPVALLLCGATAPNLLPAPAAAPITGDYVEARTAAVFAGPCHYNAELMSTGKDALLAWNVTAGSYNGISLAGLRAMAAVTSDLSLGYDHTFRQTELVIDPSATDAQALAFTALLRAKCSDQFGNITAVRRASISFTDSEHAYNVSCPGFGSINTAPMPDAGCCAQPNLVWFSPLVPVANRKVGFTQSADYTAGTNSDPWNRSEENDAFYGNFAL